MEISLKKGEIKPLTGIRGIAALVVAIHHFISKYYINYFEERSSNSMLDYFAFNYANHGYLMVELFFILSGFVLALSYDKKWKGMISKINYKQFMVKRFNRVYPLYFFSTIVYFFVFNLDKIKSPEILISNFLFLELWFPKEFTLNNVSWSLCTEWFLYLIFPYLLLMTRTIINKPFVLFFIASIIFVMAPLLNTQKIYDDEVDYVVGELRMSNGTGAFLRCLGSYIIGLAIYGIYKFNNKFVKLMSQYWYIILVLIMIAYGISYSDIVVTLLFGMLILALTQRNKISSFFESRTMYFLGLISYSIYLNHMVFLRILNFSYKTSIWNDTPINVAIGFVIFVVMTIVSSWLTYKLIELPCTRWLNSRLVRQKI